MNYGVSKDNLDEFFTKEQLERLIKEGLIHDKEGKYFYSSIRNFTAFIKFLMSSKGDDSVLADSLLNFCFSTFPNYYPTTHMAFIKAIEENDYQSSFKYFEILLRCPNAYYSKLYRIILLLLDYITELPANLKTVLNGLRKEDFLSNEEEIRTQKNGALFQELYYSIIYSRFHKACTVLKRIRFEGNEAHQDTALILKLVNRALNKQKKYKNTLIELIKSGDIRGSIRCIEEERSFFGSVRDKYMLYVLYDMERMKYLGTCEPQNCDDTCNIYDAIEARNYVFAKQMMEKLDNRESILSILLDLIIEEAKELEDKKVSLTSEGRINLVISLLDEGISILGITRIAWMSITEVFNLGLQRVSDLIEKRDINRAKAILIQLRKMAANNGYMAELLENFEQGLSAHKM